MIDKIILEDIERIKHDLRKEDFSHWRRLIYWTNQNFIFCYVMDIVSGLMLLTSRGDNCGKVINMGTSEEITILELAWRIKKSTSSKSALTFHPLPEDDPRRRCPHISLAKRPLGWEPKISLEEGLKRKVTWFRTKSAQIGFKGLKTKP